MAVVLCLTAAAQAQLVTGNDLLDNCKDQLGPGAVWCIGYVVGAADAVAPPYCVPQGVTRGQILGVVVHFLETRPKDRHRPAALLIQESLQQAWPSRAR